MRRSLRLLSVLGALGLLAAACGDDGDTASTGDTSAPTTAPAGDTGDGDDGDLSGQSLTVYSGRSEELVQPIIDRFEAETGVRVEVRYGDTAEMAALILEEGLRSPADVYFGQDAGALGALSDAGRLAALDDDVLDRVAAAYRSDTGDWVGVSGRSRTVVYNTGSLSEGDLPDSILDFTEPEWQGRIGWAPTNGSFQAFVTALRVTQGEDVARSWLEGIKANGAQVYEKNTAIVEAVAAGEVEVGFVNHYYLFRYLAEDPSYPAAQKFFGDDIGGLINVAGVGILEGTENEAVAKAFVEYLLGEDAQEYFAQETYEIPLVAGIEPAEGVPGFEDLTIPDIDLNRLEDLEGTLSLLTELGIV